MAISDERINELVAQYERERDRFEKLAREISTICKDVVARNAIRAHVTWRDKDPDRLRAKLTRDRAKHTDATTLDDLNDLAGVRVMSYVERERSILAEKICAVLCDDSHSDPAVPDTKDKVEGNGKYYRSIHIDAYLPKDELAGTNANLQGACCEVQVTSLLAHAWNEIEHDLAYKPLSGALSDGEKRLIDALGSQMISGDRVIEQLLEMVEARLATEGESIGDVFELHAQLRQHLGSAAPTRLGDNIGDLLLLMEALAISDVNTLVSTYLTDGWSDEARAECERVVSNWEKTRFAAPDHQSADLLTVQVLRKTPQERLNEALPVGRGRSGPVRIHSLSKYVDRA